MTMFRKQIVYAILSFCLMTMIFLGSKAYAHAKAYEDTTALLVSHMEVGELAEFQLQELAELFSFGFLKNEKKEELKKIRKKQELHKVESRRYTVYFVFLLLVMLSAYLIVSVQVFTFFTSLSALITLIFGLVTPIMMVIIHKDIKYLGDLVLSFESKGIMGSVEKLFDSGDVVIAIVILLFSVLIPVAKTLSLLFVSVFIKSPFAQDIVKFFKMIGKWSMVDVFVVATFLVYLTGSSGDVSRAEVEVGLYFFLAYVMVSMLASLSADKMLQTN